MTDPINKQQLLELIERERARWDALVASLNAEQLTQPGVVGEWSIKDMIAHIRAWESRPVAWLTAIRTGTRPQPAPWSANLTEEQVNAWIWQVNHDRPLDTVLAESSATHRELMDLLRTTPEEDISTSHKFAWFTSGALIDGISGNSFEHYQEHAAQIRKWLEPTRVP